MDYVSSPVCAKKFFEQVSAVSEADPNAAEHHARQFARAHDTAEFSTQQRLVVRCRIGNCAVTVSREEDTTRVEAPTCIEAV